MVQEEQVVQVVQVVQEVQGRDGQESIGKNLFARIGPFLDPWEAPRGSIAAVAGGGGSRQESSGAKETDDFYDDFVADEGPSCPRAGSHQNRYVSLPPFGGAGVICTSATTT